jgi:hypothetical protein
MLRANLTGSEVVLGVFFIALMGWLLIEGFALLIEKLHFIFF